MKHKITIKESAGGLVPRQIRGRLEYPFTSVLVDEFGARFQDSPEARPLQRANATVANGKGYLAKLLVTLQHDQDASAVGSPSIIGPGIKRSIAASHSDALENITKSTSEHTVLPGAPGTMEHNSGNVNPRKQVVVALTGATGQLIGIRTLEALRKMNVETHLIMSHWAETTMKYETDYSPANVRALADHHYQINDMAAPVSSGSFKCDGMIVVPCSAKTLAAIAAGYGEDLVARTADVMLKERRRLILAVRESPFNLIHLRNMTTVTEAGGIITPPVSAYYNRPNTIEDLIDQWIGRTLDLFDLDTRNFRRWTGWVKD